MRGAFLVAALVATPLAPALEPGGTDLAIGGSFFLGEYDVDAFGLDADTWDSAWGIEAHILSHLGTYGSGGVTSGWTVGGYARQADQDGFDITYRYGMLRYQLGYAWIPHPSWSVAVLPYLSFGAGSLELDSAATGYLSDFTIIGGYGVAAQTTAGIGETWMVGAGAGFGATIGDHELINDTVDTDAEIHQLGPSIRLFAGWRI